MICENYKKTKQENTTVYYQGYYQEYYQVHLLPVSVSMLLMFLYE